MGIKTSIICDVCGAEKVESNHWFDVGTFENQFDVTHFESGRETTVYKIVCGEACAHKLLSQWFDSQRKAKAEGEGDES